MSTVWSNEDVDTAHVILDMLSAVNHFGRYLKNGVDDEKMVNPVSFGDAVAPAKNWNLYEAN